MRECQERNKERLDSLEELLTQSAERALKAWRKQNSSLERCAASKVVTPCLLKDLDSLRTPSVVETPNAPETSNVVMPSNVFESIPTSEVSGESTMHVEHQVHQPPPSSEESNNALPMQPCTEACASLPISTPQLLSRRVESECPTILTCDDSNEPHSPSKMQRRKCRLRKAKARRRRRRMFGCRGTSCRGRLKQPHFHVGVSGANLRVPKLRRKKRKRLMLSPLGKKRNMDPPPPLDPPWRK